MYESVVRANNNIHTKKTQNRQLTVKTSQRKLISKQNLKKNNKKSK